VRLLFLSYCSGVARTVIHASEVSREELTALTVHIRQTLPYNLIVRRIPLIRNQGNQLAVSRILTQCGEMVISEQNSNLAWLEIVTDDSQTMIRQLRWPPHQKLLDSMDIREHLLFILIQTLTSTQLRIQLLLLELHKLASLITGCNAVECSVSVTSSFW
jgi:hypothetical protein